MRRKLSLAMLLLIDAAIISLTLLLALMIRFEDMTVDFLFITMLLPLMPMVILSRLITFYAFGLYHRLWRYASINELLAIGGAVTLSSAVIVTYTVLSGHNEIPKSVHVISWFLTIILIGLSRLCVRITFYLRQITHKKETLNVLIVGAGDAGAMIAREIKHSHNSNKIIVGFIDDDPYKHNQMIFGVKIIGDKSVIRQTVIEHRVNEIIIAMSSIGGNIIREVLNECKQTTCIVKILPGMYEMIDGRVGVQQLRAVNVEDLLRRDPIQLDLGEIAKLIRGKSVLVTGAGGSIGTELCRQIAKLAPKSLVLLGKGENSIYEINRELQLNFPTIEIKPVVADIRDRRRIKKIFITNRPQIVFHAAAHKHVPLMELQPEEAVHNNIFGTKVVAEAADKAGSEVFVMISTDKAVNPSSIMGATKRVAELVIQSISKTSQTKFVVVRFGNVLGSRGSVIPLFKKQIAMGGPITVTHPEMTRYFMTIPEAVQLVLQAGSMAKGGEIFVLDMGKPVKIIDLAHDLIELSGLVPNKDIKIEYTGIRPGEKLFEELLTVEEGIDATKHEKIFVANIKNIDEKQFQQWLTALRQTFHDDEIVEIIQRMITTYSAGSSFEHEVVNSEPVTGRDNKRRVKNNKYAGDYQPATGLIN